MRRELRSRNLCLLAALPLCACTMPLVTADSPKSVRAHPIAPYEWHEECLHLETGDRVEFTFESTEPVDFNIHYHEGQAVVMPSTREKSREHAGFYTARLAQDYCLMWEAGAAGASIDYRILVKPAAS